MRFRVLFLDLDDTLYPSSSGVWQAIGERINDYIEVRLGIPRPQVAALRDRYFRTYGTTLNGLLRHHGVDPHDYLDYVHDLALEERLAPDRELRALLERLPQKRVVFTNASRGHAERVLAALDIRPAIDQVVDILALEMVNKPRPESYQRAMALAGEADARACVVVDDSPANLQAAAALGMTAVRVGPPGADGAEPLRIDRIGDLLRAVPDLLGTS